MAGTEMNELRYEGEDIIYLHWNDTDGRFWVLYDFHTAWHGDDYLLPENAPEEWVNLLQTTIENLNDPLDDIIVLVDNRPNPQPRRHNLAFTDAELELITAGLRELVENEADELASSLNRYKDRVRRYENAQSL